MFIINKDTEMEKEKGESRENQQKEVSDVSRGQSEAELITHTHKGMLPHTAWHLCRQPCQLTDDIRGFNTLDIWCESSQIKVCPNGQVVEFV